MENRQRAQASVNNYGGNAPDMGADRGSPLPLGATWMEEEQAFNFAVQAEHAESVTLLLYAAKKPNNPVLQLDWTTAPRPLGI